MLAINNVHTYVSIFNGRWNLSDWPAASTGGFFDGQTSSEERREYLLSILNSDGQAKGSAGQDLTPSELNKLLARGKAEAELFEGKTQQWEASGRAVPSLEPAAATSGEPQSYFGGL